MYTFIGYVWLRYSMPRFDVSAPVRCFVTVFGLFYLWCIVWSHFKCITTPPGSPPTFKEIDEDTELQQVLGDMRSEMVECARTGDKGFRSCRKCLRIKPQRTHHCSVCKVCVLKMDHHCPWMNRCVGFENYKYFVLFLSYLWQGCLFVIITCYWQFSEVLFHPRRSGMGYAAREKVSLMYITCVSIFFALLILGGFHLYLVLRNKTTIEFQESWAKYSFTLWRSQGQQVWRNPYDLGLRASDLNCSSFQVEPRRVF